MKTNQLSSATLRRMTEATLSMPHAGGRAVVMRGGLIVTATHCLETMGAESWAGSAALGEYHIERLVAHDGSEFVAQVLAAEAISDIAVLGPLDDQEAPDHAQRYADVLAKLPSLPLVERLPRVGSTTPLWVRNAAGDLVQGEMEVTSSLVVGRGMFSIRSTTPVDSGSSGGPVITKSGRLLGVVSNSFGTPLGEVHVSSLHLACMALPPWAITHIRRGDEEYFIPES